MAKIQKQLRSEFRRLPLVLGKLFGATLAVIGFPAMVIVSRPPGASAGELFAYGFAGVVGLLVFVLCGRSLKRARKQNDAPAPTRAEQAKTSLLAWIVLVGLAAAAILGILTFTR
jgi:hypothetical protein